MVDLHLDLRGTDLSLASLVASSHAFEWVCWMCVYKVAWHKQRRTRRSKEAEMDKRFFHFGGFLRSSQGTRPASRQTVDAVDCCPILCGANSTASSQFLEHPGCLFSSNLYVLGKSLFEKCFSFLSLLESKAPLITSFTSQIGSFLHVWCRDSSEFFKKVFHTKNILWTSWG